MMISLQDAEERLNSVFNPCRVEVRVPQNGNHGGTPWHSLDEQAEIAALAHIKPAREVAEEKDISIGQVYNLKHGRSDGESLNPELVKKTEEKLVEVKDKALVKLMCALDLLTDEKIGKSSAKDIANVAAAMAKVVDRTTKKENFSSQNVLVIYAPQQKDESKFQTMDI